MVNLSIVIKENYCLLQGEKTEGVYDHNVKKKVRFLFVYPSRFDPRHFDKYQTDHFFENGKMNDFTFFVSVLD